MSFSYAVTGTVLRILTGWALFWALWLPPVSVPAAESAPGFAVHASTNRVGRYQRIEFTFGLSENYTNPFNPQEVQVDLCLTAPSGLEQTIPAFYGQEYERRDLGPGLSRRDWIYPVGLPGWKARFSPQQPGVYRAVGLVRDSHGLTRSSPITFECVLSDSRGFIRVSQKDPRFLEFSEGEPFFGIGQNLAFIGSQQYVTLSRAEEIFRRLAENGANYLRVWASCEDWAMAIEAPKSAWGRSWDRRPPLVDFPDSKAGKRVCLSMSDKGLKLDPSHPVALRPSHSYLLSGSFRAERGAALQVDCSLRHHLRPQGPSAADTWQGFVCELETGAADFWLPPITFRVEGGGPAWLTDISLREAEGGPELLWEAEVNRPARGFYNPLDCFLLDQLVQQAEENRLYLQVCLLTRDLYMEALKEPDRPAYDRAIQDACNLLRYAVARWGYSTSVAAWEYWNEMNPGLPTDRFYSSVGAYLEKVDSYHHLRTTSTWGPSARDCRHPQLDLADVHFYLRPSDQNRLADEVDAVIERSRWLREHSAGKPAHLGEFGLADEKWGPRKEMQESTELVDFHNGLWASALSGTCSTALFWWWERLDQRDAYPVYKPLSQFLAAVPWTTGKLRPVNAQARSSNLRVIGLRSEQSAWFWIFNRDAAWGETVVQHHVPAATVGAVISLTDFPGGTYRVRWWDTFTGSVLRQDTLSVSTGDLDLSVPGFTRDLACEIVPGS